MKFNVAKNDRLHCYYCKEGIQYGTHYLLIFLKEGVSKRRGILLFHLECYPKWSEAVMLKKYFSWEGRMKPTKKRGRPRKYATVEEAQQANREKSLANYHRRKENGLNTTTQCAKAI